MVNKEKAGATPPFLYINAFGDQGFALDPPGA
ncbi:hypothetical protein WCLP8_2580012 [uncultured Gammaproteobacteria bacterium]